MLTMVPTTPMSKMLRCSQDDTKKSFDFTGKLQKLNESCGSQRLSFVEQLENAFHTLAPAAIDLRYDFDLRLRRDQSGSRHCKGSWNALGI
jgi:hypothetical protein